MLVSAVLYLGKSKLEAVVVDGGGARRRITVSWMTKELTNIPPRDWAKTALFEAELQRGEDLAEETGRKIP